MNTELLLEAPRTSLKQHGKNAKVNSLTDNINSLIMTEQHQVAMFMHSKLYAIGTYYSTQDHGMIVLSALNKTPLLNLGQRPTERVVASRQTWQMIWLFRNLEEFHVMA